MRKLLALKELDQKQQEFYKKYEHDSNFLRLLELKTYYEIPHTIDYFRLAEKEVGEKKMTAFFRGKIAEKEEANKEAGKIRNCFTIENNWSHLLFPVNQKHLTTPEDIKTIDKLCKTLAKNEDDSCKILVSFFKNLVKAKQDIKLNKIDKNHSLEDYLKKIPDNWYAEPWYYTYVQYFGTGKNGKGDFATLKKQLDYLEEIDIKNIYILPHYQSPNGDAGYDISDYKPSKDFGGDKKFEKFITEATKRGFKVATDLVFNHSSAEHKWFEKALKGESKYFDYYLKCPSTWKTLDIKEVINDENGDFFLYLPEKDEYGQDVISKRILIFPDVDKTLWLKKKVKNLEKEVLFYREFYPFQVDLDLQNPGVMDELFKFLGKEISMGVLGKRTDAIAHWIKKPGTDAKDLPETYALQMLIKQFLKHLSDKAIILPEVVTTSLKLKEYAGEKTTINNKVTTTGGDALFDFQLQQILREMVYLQDTTPFWTQAHKRGKEGTNTSVPLLPIEHHDETYMGFIQNLEKMREYITSPIENPRGIIYKNGMSAGARYASCLDNNKKRIAAAFFCLYIMPAVPVIYYGSDIGAANRYDQMQKRQKEQFETLKNLLGEEYAGEGKPITFEKCKDPRELQRGSITKKEFQKALKENYPALEVIKKMNILRKNYSALSSYNFCDVYTGHHSILGMIKYPGEPKSKAPLLFAFANLSAQELTAKVPLEILRTRAKINDANFEKLISSENINIYRQEENINISLPPFGFTLLKEMPYAEPYCG